MAAEKRNPRVRGGDRSVRNLDALKRTASTSRVLNLLAVAETRDPDDGVYLKQPFFSNPVLNESIILKHRVRQDERFVFDFPPTVATKVILPFERSDLRLGGQSCFVGQRGWLSILEELTQDTGTLQRDAALLRELNSLPSLDPFLMKESLIRKGYSIAPNYFAISDADMEKMQNFVGIQIQALIELAFPNQNNSSSGLKMAGVILSTTIDERLEPLRNVMRLDAESYREGIFSWKGFLYYKWALNDLLPRLSDVLDEIPMLKSSSFVDNDQSRMIEASKFTLAKTIHLRRLEVQEALQVYDDAYRDLTQNDHPMAFRDFLMNAPSMFVVLGERIGVISHIVSFWQYRFPSGVDLIVPAEEIIDILHDVHSNLDGFNVENFQTRPVSRRKSLRRSDSANENLPSTLSA